MNLKNTVIAVSIMMLGLITVKFSSSVESVPARKSLSEFPMQIGEWKGKEEKFSPQIYDVLGVDDSILANYRNSKELYINLYIGFYKSQRKGDLIHSPKNCMPGAGWNIVDSNLINIAKAPNGEKNVKIIKLILRNGDKRQLMLYWFHSRGRIIASEYWQKIFLVVDSIFKHRTDGSFVRLITPISGDDEHAALTRLVNFAETLMPLLGDYLPD